MVYSMDYNKLTQKKHLLDAKRPFSPEIITNLRDWFKIELTYTSNAIEGNTLTRRETALVIEKGLTVGGKSLIEHLEANNHAHALDFLYSLVERKPQDLSLKDILAIHHIILNGIDDDNAGHYRSVPVRISGSLAIMPNPLKVPFLMDEFYQWLTSTQDNLHPIALAGEAHYRLVSINPFIDGNGRTARLLMNLLLLMAGYPPAIIRKRDRLAYITALEQAQLGNSKEPYDKLIMKAVDRSLDIYLNATRHETTLENLDTDDLLKIGTLAKAVNVAPSTIRYWTKEGLLSVASTTPSGYQLYTLDTIERCSLIKTLKNQRLTLQEIKTQLLNI